MAQLFIAAIIAYCIGSIPTGYVVARWIKGIDIRQFGSGNTGATNVFRVLGKPYGILVLICDALKGFIPAALFVPLFNVSYGSLTHADLALLIGIAAIVGHVFSIFMRFRGGKGVATSTGVFLAIAPLPVLIACAILIPVIILTRMVSVGSLSGAVLLPILIRIFQPESTLVFFMSIGLGLLIIYRHRDNIKRLLKGQEKKFF